MGSNGATKVSTEYRRDRAHLTVPRAWTPNQAPNQSEDEDDDEDEDEHLPVPGVMLWFSLRIGPRPLYSMP